MTYNTKIYSYLTLTFYPLNNLSLTPWNNKENLVHMLHVCNSTLAVYEKVELLSLSTIWMTLENIMLSEKARPRVANSMQFYSYADLKRRPISWTLRAERWLSGARKHKGRFMYIFFNLYSACQKALELSALLYHCMCPSAL